MRTIEDSDKRELLSNMIMQWNQNRLDLFHISLPNEVSLLLNFLPGLVKIF